MKPRDRIRAAECCAGLQSLLSPKLFKALSDPRRIALIVRLAEAGEACTIGTLARGSGVDLSVVSRHLSTLREAGIIECEKRGKEVWCEVKTRTVAKILHDVAAALEACCPERWCPDAADSVSPTRGRRPGPAGAR